MPMINKNKYKQGVTLVALVVTIVVMGIILSITITYNLGALRRVADEKRLSELRIVQEAVMQRYGVLQSSGKQGIIADAISIDTKISNDINRPKELVGTRISTIKRIEDEGFSRSNVLITYEENNYTMVYEEYYYLLNKDDLLSLGIERENEFIGDSTEVSYIVNYSTGEVFDIVNKKYKKANSSRDTELYVRSGSEETSGLWESDYGYKYNFGDFYRE